MAGTSSIRLDGDRELMNLLRELPKRVASKGNKAAVTAAAKPVRAAAKAAAPRQSGLLKKAIGSKIKTYKGGANGTPAVAIIGARVEVEGTYKGRKRVPAKYIALVALGHGGPAPAAAQPFLQDAYRATKTEAVRLAAEKFKAVVETEAAKLGKR